jgi:hypothetical protein
LTLVTALAKDQILTLTKDLALAKDQILVQAQAHTTATRANFQSNLQSDCCK